MEYVLRLILPDVLYILPCSFSGYYVQDNSLQPDGIVGYISILAAGVINSNKYTGTRPGGERNGKHQ